MTNCFICTHDFLILIAEQINDSLVWCRFSQTCKKANKICKQLLKYHERRLVGRPKIEIYYTLPTGIKHGLAKTYRFGKRDGERLSNEYYYKNNKRTFLSIDFWSKLGIV